MARLHTSRGWPGCPNPSVHEPSRYCSLPCDHPLSCPLLSRTVTPVASLPSAPVFLAPSPSSGAVVCS